MIFIYYKVNNTITTKKQHKPMNEIKNTSGFEKLALRKQAM